MSRIRHALLCLIVLATPAAAAPPEGFAERVEALRERSGAPGFTVAIVENGEVTMARGFGVTDLANPAPVTADTNFAIGSVSKAFTTTALALLVDEGRIGWDDKVIDHMPEFRMHDPWVTREMTVRDLLVHRSGLGLGAGDLLFVPRSNLTRAEIVERLANIPPETSFRSDYAYDNILYMVAGRLIERVSGMSWERFMRERVLLPAGMRRATVDNAERGNRRGNAHPHARLDGAIRGLGTMERLADDVVVPQVAAPAGGIAASANDMARWIRLQLAQGDLPGEARLFSEAASRELFRPVVLMPAGALPAPLGETQPLFNTYALGWNVRDYRGERIVMHGGGVFGSITRLVLIPERNVGFYIATNSEESGLLAGLTFELLDHYLAAPRRDWPQAFTDFLAARRDAAVAALAAPAAQPAQTGPSLPLAGYAGAYRDAWFGTITVREENGALAVDFPHWPGITATLEHWQYDTFRTRFNDRGVEPAYVTFALGPDGKAERITMRAVSPVADFSFDYDDLVFRPVAAAE
ncbi:serine hydrolase [Sphingosinicella terrae]|uniref:serine hydrolase n=1 Tax=Sphingosinicella terrae TaxID=2172047 RepID=UPI000E0DB1DF|nr:serine hydrolase [Sphingosinicella terrae]